MKKSTICLLIWLCLPNLTRAQCAITSAPTNNCGYGDTVDAFSLNSISSPNSPGCGTNGYSAFSTPIWTLTLGSTYPWTASVGGGYYNEGVGIWIDFNNDGFYTAAEFITSSAPAMTHASSMTIPYAAVVGVNLRMRVRIAYNTSVTSGQACTNGIGSYGETEDYFVKFVCPASVPAVTIASSTVVCSGYPLTLTASGLGTYTWTGGVTNGVAFAANLTSYTVTAAPSLNNACPSNSVTGVRTISVNATPTITGIASGSICPGGSFIMTPGGASTYSYSGPSTTLTGSSATVSPIVTSSYSVTGTGTNGCVALASTAGFATVTALASPSLTLTASPSASACPGITSSISVTGANTYTWVAPSSSQSLVSVNPSVTTVYTVSGTGTTVCNGIKNFTLFVYPTPTISVNSNSICAGKVFTMVPTMIPGGAATYTYANGSSTISPATNTAVNVVGTSTNGCITPTAAVSNITVVTLPVVTVNSGTICTGSIYVMTPSGATSYTFVNASNPATPSVTTTYSVIGSTTVGCASLPALSTVTVYALPVVSVVATPSNMILCNNTILSLTASGAATYSWNNTTGGATFTSTPSSSSGYFVIATDINGCTGAATIPFTVNPSPVLSLAGNTFVCLGNSSTLTVTGSGLTYSGTATGTATTAVVSPSTTTVYGVTGTNTLGCSSTKTLAVNVNTILVTASSNTAICMNGATALSAPGANSYTWMPVPSPVPFNAITVSPTITTTYTYVAIDAKACSHTGMITVTVNPLPVVTATGSSTIICTGESATITAGGASTYVWNNPSNSTAGSLTVNPTSNATYVVAGTDANGCVSTGSTVLTVSKCTGVNKIENEIAGLSVYPNPNNGEFTVELNNGLNKTIEVSDLTGRVILTTQTQNDKTVVNLNNLANGVYYVKIQSNQSVEVMKVVKH